MSAGIDRGRTLPGRRGAAAGFVTAIRQSIETGSGVDLPPGERRSGGEVKP